MHIMRDMVLAAEAAGIPRQRALQWAGGLRVDMLDTQKARVSLAQFSRLYGALVLHTGNEGAGLSCRAVPRGTMETMCRAGLTTSTLVEAVGALAKALNATMRGMSVQRAVDTSSVRIVITETDPIVERRQSTYEVLLLTLYGVLSWLLDHRLPLLSADFPCPAPRHRFELRTLFAGSVRFNQPHAALRFSTGQGGMPVVRSVGELPKLLRRAPASLIEALIQRGDLKLEIRKRLYAALPKPLTIEDAARQLSISPRTLHRKLIAEGTSFQRIKDELRRDVALRALTHTRQPLKKIAELVGFQDQSSFQRAFLNWTGRSPGATRGLSGRRS